ncbi:MAG: hypothetical protein Q7T82_19530 [Armatimonadota bacterium]|nr:hypothetical protein [Armatimonadota bacterium]
MDLDKIVSELKSERDRIDRAISALADGAGAIGLTRGTVAGVANRGKGISAAGRRRLSEAMKARWAAGKFKSAVPAPASAGAKRRRMSPAARKLIAVAMKKRWAEKKSAGAKAS